MITKELVEEAIDLKNDLCIQVGTCIHADAFAGNIGKFTSRCVKYAKEHDNDPIALVYLGVHIGYELRRLEAQEATVPTPAHAAQA